MEREKERERERKRVEKGGTVSQAIENALLLPSSAVGELGEEGEEDEGGGRGGPSGRGPLPPILVLSLVVALWRCRGRTALLPLLRVAEGHKIPTTR